MHAFSSISLRKWRSARVTLTIGHNKWYSFSRLRAWISGRAGTDNETNPNERVFDPFVSIHYAGNELASGEELLHGLISLIISIEGERVGDIPDRGKWKRTFCHSLRSHPVPSAKYTVCPWRVLHRGPLNIRFTMHQIASGFVQSSRVLRLASIVRYRKQAALPVTCPPFLPFRSIFWPFPFFFLCIAWLPAPMPSTTRRYVLSHF